MSTRFSKSILVLAAACLFSAGSVFAGNGPGDGVCDGPGDGTCIAAGDGNRGAQNRTGDPAGRMAGMARRLGLTLNQQLLALELFDAQAGDREMIRARIMEDYGEEICAQRELHRSEFLALLTPEQLALHEEMQLQRKRGGGGNGFGGFECPDPEGN